ncbi:MAG: aminotransferase class V-fold PLP-dependent enzyme [Lentisphaeria bacterium]|nr:aminotransferase class V-fold PLP-dependent enzyme [Lentisphaeria bacterium]
MSRYYIVTEQAPPPPFPDAESIFGSILTNRRTPVSIVEPRGGPHAITTVISRERVIRYSSDIVYLDHAAGSPPLAGLFQRWEALSRRCFANPHGTTTFSADCKVLLHQAERRTLAALGIPPEQAAVIWTSGGTEALNLAIHGVRQDGRWLVDSTAHPAVLAPVQAFGVHVTTLPADRDGILSIPTAMDSDISALAVTHVNNETGAIQDLVRLRRDLPTQREAPLMIVDALQSAGKTPPPWVAARIDLLAVGGRKMGAPAGIGALIVRRGINIRPLMFGGGQQRGIRPGTVDVPAAALFAEILSEAAADMTVRLSAVSALRETLTAGLRALSAFHPRVISPLTSSPYITCVSFPGFEGAVLTRLLAEKRVIIGSGSACSAEAGEPSHALTAMGYDERTIRGALRVSFGPESTRGDVAVFLTALESVLHNY